MSSALTGNKIKDSYQALLKMGTNGSLDPVTPIAISDGLGNDTPLLLSGIEFKTQVVSTAKPYGFWADLSANSHVAVGDYAGQYNGTFLYVNDINKLIQANNGGSIKGLNLDFANNIYTFGTSANGLTVVDGVNKYVNIYSGNNPLVDLDGSNNISRFGGQGAYLRSDGNVNYLTLGDYGGNYNNVFLEVDDFNQIIQTNKGNARGLKLDFANNNYRFGDINGNTAYLNIDINYSSLFGYEVAYLESSNKQAIVNNGLNQLIYTTNDNGTYSGDRGFQLDFANGLYKFGDFNAVNNSTHINIDDNAESITITADQDLAFVGAGLENTGAGGSSGKYLRILLNNNEYKIELLDP